MCPCGRPRPNVRGLFSSGKVINVPDSGDWTLRSSRLILGPMVQDDAPELFSLLQEPALHQFTGNAPPASCKDLRAKIRLWERRHSPTLDELWLNWTLRLRSNGLTVGKVQATVHEQTAELAWTIGVPFQGQGYATEASRCVATWILDYCGVTELRASIHPDHIVSQRVATHVGMRPSGELTDEDEEIWVTR